MPSAESADGFTLAELAAHAGAILDGSGEIRIRTVGTLESAGPDAIAFLANPKYRSQLRSTRAGAVIVAPADATATPLPKLVSPQPYATYARVASLLYPPRRTAPGVHASARVDPTARIAPDASIAANAVIGARALVASRAFVGPGAVVGDDASIGEEATLHANVVVYARCIVGPRTTLYAGAVIGADGFGMAEAEGRWLRVPQVGRVVIGADCEVGANTTIDRGAIDDTVIEDDVKLDNQIQVGHNCTIGRHTAIAACVAIAGSTHIGRNCRIGGASAIAGHLTIPDGTVVSGGTTIIGSPRAAAVYTSIFPALPHAAWRNVASELRRLDALVQRVKALEQAAASRNRSEGT